MTAKERLNDPDLKNFERWGTVHYLDESKGSLFMYGLESTPCGLKEDETPDRDSDLKYVTCKSCLKSLIKKTK